MFQLTKCLKYLSGHSISCFSIRTFADGYNSSDPFFVLSFVEPDDESNDTDTSSTNSSAPIKVTAQFNSAEYPGSAFNVEFKNGILDLTMYGPYEYANLSYGQGLLGKHSSNILNNVLFTPYKKYLSHPYVT